MKIVAHRGASAVAPENTMAAFRLAVEAGADAIEFDVQATADGRLVVLHDATLDRTTDGTGALFETDWTTIAGVDAGSWFSSAYTGERVPALGSTVGAGVTTPGATNIISVGASCHSENTRSIMAERRGRWSRSRPPMHGMPMTCMRWLTSSQA